jgi:hypothetical protein
MIAMQAIVPVMIKSVQAYHQFLTSSEASEAPLHLTPPEAPLHLLTSSEASEAPLHLTPPEAPLHLKSVQAWNAWMRCLNENNFNLSTFDLNLSTLDLSLNTNNFFSTKIDFS